MNKLVKNGLYIPPLHLCLHYITNDFFLSTIITQKLYVTNYYYHFEHLYDFVPHPYNWIKQFVRFTDTGHIVSFLYYFEPRFLPLAHNVHFMITFGYWVSKLCLGMSDADDRHTEETILWFERSWVYANHGLVYALVLYKIMTDTTCTISFSNTDLQYTYMWLYAWFIFIYIPWRYYTRDPVYSILNNHSSLKTKITIFIMMNSFVYLSNYIGYILSHTCQMDMWDHYTI